MKGKMDLFREESIHKVDSGLNTFVFVIANIGMVLFGFIGLNMLMSILNGRINTVNIVGFVIFGGLAFGLFILRNNQKIEYDYTFTNGTLDIAKVINNTKRKKLLSTNIKDFEAIASTKDEGFTRMLQHPGIKKINYFLNKGGGLYYGVFNHGGAKSILIFEPSEEMVKLFKTVNPRNVKTLSNS